MRKAELVKKVAKATGESQRVVKKVLDGIIKEMIDSLQKGENIYVYPLGSFRVVVRKSRSGRNPKTGEKITIPSKKVVKFNPASSIRVIK